jgi:hypothetical protein
MYFQVGGGPLGKSLAGVSCSGLLLMISIVNRAVAKGGGDEAHRYGRSILAIWTRYVSLFAKSALNPKSFGIFEVASMVLLVGSAVAGVRAIIQQARTSY